MKHYFHGSGSLSRTKLCIRVLIISGIITIVLSLFMQIKADFHIPDMQFYTAAEEVIEIHDGLSSRQLEAYQWARGVDMIYPLAYFMFLSSALYLLALKLLPGVDPAAAKPGPKGRPAWIPPLLPLLTAVFDYIENILLMRTLDVHPKITAAAETVGYFTAAKWIGMVLTAAMLVGLLFAWGIHTVHAGQKT